MIKHYCDVCGKEVNCFEVNTMIMVMRDPLYMNGLIIADKEINNELCGNCARKIALYIKMKCNEED